MPYEVATFPAHRLGVVRLFDTVTGDTLLQALEALYGSETWTPGYNTIWDGREITELMISPAEADIIVDQIRHLESRMGRGCTAIVVRNEMDFSLAHMLHLKADTERRQRSVFYSLEEALDWVGALDGIPSEKLRRTIRRPHPVPVSA